MSNPRTKSSLTLVNLGPRLDRVVVTLGRLSHTSYASVVRALVLSGVRAQIESGSFQGWKLSGEIEKILDQEESDLTVTSALD